MLSTREEEKAIGSPRRRNLHELILEEDSSSDSDSENEEVRHVRAPSNDVIELVKVEEIDFKWKDLFGAYFDETKTQSENLVENIDWTALLLEAAADGTGSYEPTKIARVAMRWKHEGFQPSNQDFYKWSNNEIGSFLATIAQLAGQILFLNFSPERKANFRANIDSLGQMFNFGQSSSTKVRLHWYRLCMLVYGESMMDELGEFLRSQTRNQIIGDQILTDHNITALSLEDRSIGCLYGAFLGDVLGAALEGDSAARISRFHPKGIRDFMWSPHMHIYQLPPRYGYFTDDTNSLLSVANSLVEHQKLDPQLMAENYAKFWKTEPERGYPDVFKKVMDALLAGRSCFDTAAEMASSDHICNAGAVRVPAIGIAFRNSSPDQLRHACNQAIISTHTSPTSQDGAAVIAFAIQYLLAQNVNDFSPGEFLKKCSDFSQHQPLKDNIRLLIDRFHKTDAPHSYESDIELLTKVGGMIFQSSSIHAIPDVLWAVVRFYNDPVQCLVSAVGFGGDTDTVACMAGALIGALHGTTWIPKRWYRHSENGEFGKDFCIKTAIELAKLDLTDS